MTIARTPLHVPDSMCEAYHYSRPAAFSRGTEARLCREELLVEMELIAIVEEP